MDQEALTLAGTSAQLRRLGAELRRLRQAEDKTQAQVAAALGRTHASVVNWERGKTRISKSDLAVLLAELRAPVAVRKELERLREDSGTRDGWWTVYGVGGWLKPLLSFEQDAVEMCTFEAILVPGLLQTEPYARAVNVAGRYTVDPSDVDNTVAARMKRQRRLAGSDPLKLRAVIAESALCLEVGGPTVMAEQLAKLLESSRKRSINLRVLPNRVGAHPSQSGNLTVLHFAEPKVDPPIAYVDGPLGGYLVHNPGDVATLIKMFDDLQDLVLTEADSQDLIADIMGGYQKRGEDDA